jgi:DNA-3-methyladenine glycosylase I
VDFYPVICNIRARVKIMRCEWCGSDPVYVKYHDEEWGRLVLDDKKLFEFIVLESAQAGLSWITILKRRENYKNAFCNFDFDQVAKMTDADIEHLMQDTGIIRNRLKIRATITNSLAFIKTSHEFDGFANYILSFFPNKKPIIRDIKTSSDYQATNDISDAMASDMKKRGFKFFGSTICYSHLQATGFIDDHMNTCFCKNKL